MSMTSRIIFGVDNIETSVNRDGICMGKIILRLDRVSIIRFSTLSAICKALHYQPGVSLEYEEDA